MMRSNSLAFIVVIFAFSSCITTLQALVTPDNIVTDDRVEGMWVDQYSKPVLVQRFGNSKFKHILDEVRQGDDQISWKDSVFYTKHYIISFREKDINYVWTAGMVKIKGQYYVSLRAEECADQQQTALEKLGEPSSSIAKLEWSNKNEVTLKFLNGKKIKEIILGGKAQIKYEYDPMFETFVITASSSELALFLERYGNNEHLYKGGNLLTLKRKN